MGYFSELDLEKRGESAYDGYNSAMEQLMWRYDDLKQRYEELSSGNAPLFCDDYFSKDDYRYAPVECFTTLSDVERAMEIAKDDLLRLYDVRLDEECDEEEEPDENQISIFEIVYLPSWFNTVVAA